jgi:hypothetical protein
MGKNQRLSFSRVSSTAIMAASTMGALPPLAHGKIPQDPTHQVMLSGRQQTAPQPGIKDVCGIAAVGSLIIGGAIMAMKRDKPTETQNKQGRDRDRAKSFVERRQIEERSERSQNRGRDDK